MTPVLGSLCSGYGGIEMGLRQAGWDFRLGFVADNDLAAATVLAHHHPEVPNLGDITTVDWWKVSPVDILTAGFPCTDVSAAGRREGLLRGNRSGLWYHVASAIDALRPNLVFLENVRGLLSARAGSDLEPCPWCVGDDEDEPALRALGAVLGTLASIGYDAAWTSLPAAAVGCCHLRWRVFIVAWPAAHTSQLGHGHPWAPRLGGVPAAAVGGPVRPDGLTLLPTPVAKDDGKSPEAHLAMKQRMPGGDRDQITSLSVLARADFVQPGTLLPTPQARDGDSRGSQPPCKRADGAGAMLDEVVCHLLPTPTARDGASGPGHAVSAEGSPDLRTTVSLLPTPRATDGTNGGPNQRGSSGDLALPSAVMLLPTPVAKDADSARNATAGRTGQASGSWSAGWTLSDVAHAERWGTYATAIARHEAAFGRPAPEPTGLGTKGQPRLSPRFVEWMMALPDGHVTAVPGLSRNDILRLLGNGVVPAQFAAALPTLLNLMAAPVGDALEREVA